MNSRILINSLVVWSFCLWPLGHLQVQAASRIINTKHNLTATGPGPIKVAGETEICKFCHTPHSANPIAPLWNRQASGDYYQTYESTTLQATVGQPTGTSRLCLSCHDGTVALTTVYNSQNPIQGSAIYITPSDTGYVGTELTDDHPISFTYNSLLAINKPGLRDPAALPPELPLDQQNQLQCTTCHDPHDDTYGDFLRISNIESQMCISCHNPDGWPSSSHATSTASLTGAQTDTWDNLQGTTVRQAGCESCHRPHSAGGRARLLRREAEEDNCLSCHDGSVATGNIASELLLKSSVHPVGNTTGIHDPTEDPLTMSQHIECVDCHNPHRTANSPAANAPLIKATMAGASGITSAGTFTAEATYEYEVCFKCHAWDNPVRSPIVDRIVRNNNVADEFSPSNPSYHPVEAQGKNSDVPSLLQPYNTTSIIYCTDCHGTDSTANGVQGPHGSSYQPLLVDNYVTIDGTSESPSVYALCYRCHSRTSILNDDSYRGHRRHIQADAPCSVCHDPHGISASQTGGSSGTHLINFDRDVVGPANSGIGPIFEDLGFRRGSCTLKCHNRNHKNKRYPMH
ncbi:MAG: hypothetical protein GWP14_03220 [Actinobacteria bacterium]|nr:hypothetical protein [Actinomycetota bacterium]